MAPRWKIASCQSVLVVGLRIPDGTGSPAFSYDVRMSAAHSVAFIMSISSGTSWKP
jgi:hypothetical protein